MAGNHMTRANASRFFVAGELSRRGFSVVVNTGRTANTHVLCSDVEGTKTVHIHVRTYEPGYGSCIVGKKAGDFLGDNFFWVLAGIPNPGGPAEFEYYIIPSRVTAENEPKYHRL